MSTLFDNHPIVPVIVIDDASKAVPLAHALLAGGIKIIEFTFRTAAAADSIKALSQNVPEMLTGAGTILTIEQADIAIAAGAQFALSPCVDAEVIKHCQKAGIPMLPGVATPSDINTALKLGCTYQKFFPAGTMGGISALKAMAAPYIATNVRFCPTGGVNLTNMADYLGMKQVFAVGGTWLATPEDIQAGNWAAITQRSKEAVAAIMS